MGKRSYLDSNANYAAAKKGMLGRSAGGTPNASTEAEDKARQKSNLLSAIKGNANLESAYRNWSKGTKDDFGYDQEPVGDFFDYAATHQAHKKGPYDTQTPAETYTDRMTKYEEAKPVERRIPTGDKTKGRAPGTVDFKFESQNKEPKGMSKYGQSQMAENAKARKKLIIKKASKGGKIDATSENIRALEEKAATAKSRTDEEGFTPSLTQREGEKAPATRAEKAGFKAAELKEELAKKNFKPKTQLTKKDPLDPGLDDKATLLPLAVYKAFMKLDTDEEKIAFLKEAGLL